MAKREVRWVRTKALSAAEKAAISVACERFIDEILKSRFLPEVRPTEFNYPADIFGKWRGAKYSFILRYRSGFADTRGEEFDVPFTRLDHLDECVTETRFQVLWRRYTGQWLLSCPSATLEEALSLIETEPWLQPQT